jgi:hypothetical protein
VWRANDWITGDDIIDPGDESRYLHARPGDHWMCPFECGGCSFYRLALRWRDPVKDNVIMCFIRRAILGKRSMGAVKANLRLFLEQAELGRISGFLMFDRPGPFLDHYDEGLRPAIGALAKSLLGHELAYYIIQSVSCRAEEAVRSTSREETVSHIPEPDGFRMVYLIYQRIRASSRSTSEKGHGHYN